MVSEEEEEGTSKASLCVSWFCVSCGLPSSPPPGGAPSPKLSLTELCSVYFCACMCHFSEAQRKAVKKAVACKSMAKPDAKVGSLKPTSPEPANSKKRVTQATTANTETGSKTAKPPDQEVPR